MLCVASFSVAFNNVIVTPVLADIAGDLGVRVAVAGLIVTAYAVVGSIAAIFSGPVMDRLGRKRVVVVGMLLLTAGSALSAVAPTFLVLVISRAIGGLGAACLTPAVFAAVGDYFAYEERAKAMSAVMSVNTAASIFGVPAGAALSGAVSWRCRSLSSPCCSGSSRRSW